VKSNKVSVFVMSGDNIPRKIDLDSSLSMNEAQRKLPDGVYTTFRTYDKHFVVRFNDHIKRLEESSLLLGKPVKLDAGAVRSALASITAGEIHPDNRLRISVDLNSTPPVLYFIVEPLSTPTDQEYDHGVSVITRTLQRDNPKAKVTQFVQKADAIRSEINKPVNEIVMVSEAGNILEGLSSNFYAILNGVVWTASEGVLQGITLRIVIDVMDRLGISCVRKGLPLHDLFRIDEAFITSASRGVLPVTLIDDMMVGDGEPGRITRLIRKNFDLWIDEFKERI
jgi:branched-chain amino acid aminotransferase